MRKTFIFGHVILWGCLMLSGCSKISMTITKAALTGPQFTISQVTASEGSNLVFTVELSEGLTGVATVDFNTLNGSAVAGTHYVTSSGTLTFNPGETSKTITIATNADTAEKCAPNRSFSLLLTNSSGAGIATSSATGTITDPDVPVISIADTSIVEGGVASFTVSLSSACVGKVVSFNWATASGTATSGTDFTARTLSSTIAMGVSSVQVTVPTTDDTIYEGNETFTVTLSAPANATLGTSMATAQILENDSIPVAQFTTASQSFSEAGGTATVLVSLSNASVQSVTVPFTLSGSAVEGAGNDYTLATSFVTIPAGSTSRAILVAINNDAINELDETIIMTMGSPTNATKGATDVHTLTITDNDPAIVSNITSPLANGTYASGVVDITVEFTSNVDVMGVPLLNLNTTPARYASFVSGSGTSTLLFRYNIEPTDMALDLDYASSSALVLAGGTIKDSLKLTNTNLTLPTPGTAGSLGANKNIAINAPDAPAIMSITIPANGAYYLGDVLDFTFTFTRTVAVAGAGTPRLGLNIGGDFVNATYVSGSGTSSLVFRYIVGANVAANGPVMTSPIDLNGSAIKDSTTNFDALLTFSAPVTTGMIVDGRSLELNFLETNPVIPEALGLNKVFTITLSGATLVPLTIPLKIGGNATPTSDYQFTATSVTIPAGQSSVTLGYDVIDDAVDELSKSFYVISDRPSVRNNLVLGPVAGAKVSILDDDPVKDRWLMVTTGYVHSCAITLSGVLKCWGGNSSGQVGDNSRVNILNPVVIDSGVTYKTIQAGSAYTCGITSADVLKCWGLNSELNYALGDGTNIDRLSPQIIDPGVTYKWVAAKQTHSCGITTTNDLKCWGNNGSGQLGDGTTMTRTTPALSDPGVRYQSVSVGEGFTCGVTISGVLKCWGANWYGQLGDGTGTNRLSPVMIDVAENYKTVSASNHHACGITTNDKVKCWGANWSGQLGDGSYNDSFVPIEISDSNSYKSLSLGPESGCGLTTSNILKCWGLGYFGAVGYQESLIPMVVDDGESYKDISKNFYHGCGITSSDILKCWGDNFWGSLGNGKVMYKSPPAVIDPGINFKVVATASSHSCGLTTSNSLKCWGLNRFGSLGDGTDYDRALPVTIDPGGTFKAIALGLDHTCAITALDVLKCWGNNFYGQLGTGNTIRYLTPTIIDAGVSYKAISAGQMFTCGITTANVLKCWGVNGNGQLGDGTFDQRTSPVIIDPGVSYIFVSTGGSSACGITSANELKCWGSNSYGQLGDGSTTTRTSPVLINSGVSYKWVSTGFYHSCGITAADVLKCWGANYVGQLGDGTTTQRLTPVIINSGTTYKSVAVNSGGNGFTCGVTSADLLKCWGYNVNQQLGDGTTTNRNAPVTSNSGVSFKTISTGTAYACGTTLTDELRCWGSNSNNQLGSEFGNIPVPVGAY